MDVLRESHVEGCARKAEVGSQVGLVNVSKLQFIPVATIYKQEIWKRKKSVGKIPVSYEDKRMKICKSWAQQGRHVNNNGWIPFRCTSAMALVRGSSLIIMSSWHT